jgi:predicted nuclease of restriction endonuclease-like (RecB) superfamily
MIEMKVSKSNYKSLLKNIGFAISNAKMVAAVVVNAQLVKANWEIGRHIVEFEQDGNERAEYGSELLASLSKDLMKLHGKGFGRRNLLDMRRFYLAYPIWQTVSAELSWSHYIELISLSDENARKFYQQKAISERLSKRELEREIDSALYERMVLSKNKKSFLSKAKKKFPPILHPHDIIKDPYVLDFLEISQGTKVTEKQLEQKLIDNLQMFLLELGKGFAFVGRQYKISIRNKHFYVDLVFYHRILKCFVLIDLKTRRVQHNDIGQMNMYLNYIQQEENVEGDKNPIGIILSAGKDEVLVEYAMGGISNKIFVSKYQLYLPKTSELKKQLQPLLKTKKHIK